MGTSVNFVISCKKNSGRLGARIGYTPFGCNACTKAAIRFFTAKYEVLQLYTNGVSFFYSEMQNLENCTQTAFLFSQQNEKFNNVPKLPVILWLQNTKIFKLFLNSHVLFDSKLKNLKFHPNCYSFFDDEIDGLHLFWFSRKIAYAHISGKQNRAKKSTRKVVNRLNWVPTSLHTSFLSLNFRKNMSDSCAAFGCTNQRSTFLCNFIVYHQRNDRVKNKMGHLLWQEKNGQLRK